VVARLAAPVALVFFKVCAGTFVTFDTIATIVSLIDSCKRFDAMTSRAFCASRAEVVFATFSALPHLEAEVFAAALAHVLHPVALFQSVAIGAHAGLESHFDFLLFLHRDDFNVGSESLLDYGVWLLVLQVKEEMFFVLQGDIVAIQSDVQGALLCLDLLVETGSAELHQVVAKIAYEVFCLLVVELAELALQP